MNTNAQQHPIPDLNDLIAHEEATAAYLRSLGMKDMTCDRENHRETPAPLSMPSPAETLALQIDRARDNAAGCLEDFGADSRQYDIAARYVHALECAAREMDGAL